MSLDRNYWILIFIFVNDNIYKVMLGGLGGKRGRRVEYDGKKNIFKFFF